jgi:very-short-patch-repair endonuclease
MPIRQLMHRCATAIQAVKPVFMMSPLSVAQFLPPGAVKFDLLVIDEASQVQPVDALGSIARAKQMIVVGDEKQLPPTRFFSRILADDREDDDQGAAPADIESILGLCKARGLPERMLRWHYRSRHQSLIAVSNSQFYESKLFIVPSPYNDEAGMGLRLHHVPENVYDRGETSTNAKEATLVAAAVLQHARTAPEQSLGVAAFSTQQRRAITDELELLRRKHPETESFFANHPNEPFFVKSLESVQGDERDVIYISVGYGRDSHGQMTMNFGPLTKEGGERRLNVLISRAKRRCEIFSSITDADIDLERAGGKGVAAFKLFLHYARTGRLSMVVQSDDEVSAVFERQVAESLKERGYNVHSRIGSAGCFVDLAVADPQFPGRYVLGIECDGVSYRDARSARDRDHLRKWVLEDQGWSIHRIWSADWFHRPQAEIERLTASIERSKANLDASPDQAARAVPAEINTVERADAVEINLVAAEETVTADKYEEAKFSAPTTRYELHELPSGLMASVVEKVVKVEGPIHRSEIVARVRSLWGLQRAGGRIQAAVEAGISHAVSQNKIEEFATDFLSMPGQEIRVRDRSDVTSLALRRPDYLPPQEIDAALHATVKENLGARLEELVLCVSRKFGFRNTSAQLREVIEARAKRLIEVGTLVRRGDDVVLAG